MDSEVKTKVKRAPQVRLENLDANMIRTISRKTGMQIPYLLREAVQLLEAKYSKSATPPQG